MKSDSVEFRSPEDLADLLEKIGMRVHAMNRMGGGESLYLWHLAETIRKTGRLALLARDRTELDVLFGDGYKRGTLSDEEQVDHFYSLLREQPTNTR